MTQTIPENSSNRETGWWDPDLAPDEFRRLGYQAVDMIADYFASIRDLPVFPGKSSQEVAAAFDEPLPWMGQPAEQILSDWPARVLPNATHLGSPRYFGFVNGSGTMLGVLAEALAASVNMNAGGAIFLTVVLIIRTGLEDKALQDELAGYHDYARQVRYRLLPGIW